MGVEITTGGTVGLNNCFFHIIRSRFFNHLQGLSNNRLETFFLRFPSYLLAFQMLRATCVTRQGGDGNEESPLLPLCSVPPLLFAPPLLIRHSLRLRLFLSRNHLIRLR